MTENGQVARENARALAIRMVMPTLALRDTPDLIALARRWDAELMQTTRESSLAGELAAALLEMHRILGDRLAADFVGESRPFARGPVGMQVASPLSGIVEHITPFGNVDVWVTFLPDPAAPRPRRPGPRPHPDPGHQPGRTPRPHRPPGPVGLDDAAAIGRQGRQPVGVVPGPVGELIPSDVATGTEFVLNIVTEVLESTIGQAVGGLIMALGVHDAIESARRTQTRAAKAWGMRLGLMSLAYLVDHEAPQHCEASDLRRLIREDTGLERRWQELNVSYPSVQTDELMMESLRDVARAYNVVIRRSESRFDAEARRRHLAPTSQDRREFRKVVGRAFVEEARQALDQE